MERAPLQCDSTGDASNLQVVCAGVIEDRVLALYFDVTKFERFSKCIAFVINPTVVNGSYCSHFPNEWFVVVRRDFRYPRKMRGGIFL